MNMLLQQVTLVRVRLVLTKATLLQVHQTQRSPINEADV